jgi:hypothetical protein
MAGAQVREPVPPGIECWNQNDQTGWCDYENSIQSSVWFTIVAPASGCINKIGALDSTDMQLVIA